MKKPVNRGSTVAKKQQLKCFLNYYGLIFEFFAKIIAKFLRKFEALWGKGETPATKIFAYFESDIGVLSPAYPIFLEHGPTN